MLSFAAVNFNFMLSDNRSSRTIDVLGVLFLAPVKNKRNNASVNSSCVHPPRATAGHLRALSVPGPGGGALANLARPGGRAFAYPRAFDTRGFQLEIQT